MKIFKSFSSLFIAFSFVFQSCVIYYNQHYEAEEVVKSQRKFRMVDKKGNKYPFYKLIEEDGNFYALAKNKIFYTNKFKDRKEADLGLIGFSAYLINPEEYNYFQIKNSSASGWATAAVIVAAAGVIIWILVDALMDDWGEFLDDWGDLLE